MKRTSFISSAMALFAIVIMFSLSACDPETATTPTNTDGADYLLATPEWIVGEVTEGTVTQEFALNVENECMLFDGTKERPKGPANHPPKQLGNIFRQLKLTADQRDDIEGFMTAFKACVEAGRLDLRLAQLPIIQAANAQRLIILTNLKAGTITAEQAKTALKALHESTKLAMTTNLDVIAAHEALKLCYETLLDNIEGILTAEQLVKWNRLIKRI